jgi:hypothetical protein
MGQSETERDAGMKDAKKKGQGGGEKNREYFSVSTVKKKQRGNAQNEKQREKRKKKEIQERSIERKRILQEGKEGE